MVPSGKNWTREECLAALRRLSEALGGARPTVADLIGRTGKEVGCPPKSVLEKLFGSFAAAVRAAGLSNLPTRRQWQLSISLSEMRGRFREYLRGRKFLLRGEGVRLVRELSGTAVPARVRREVLTEMCREMGIRMLALPDRPAIRKAVDWLLKQGLDGEGVRQVCAVAGVSEEELQLLLSAIELGSLPAAARAAGYGSSHARKLVMAASEKLARYLLAKSERG